jgi:hypothetical protein
MNKYNKFSAALFFLMLSSLSACGKGTTETAAEKSGEIKQDDVCSLLTQAEVDSLFGKSVGAGKSDLAVPHVQGCIWPATGIPSFILQVLPAPASVHSSIDPGKGYQVIDLEGLGDQAAVAIQQANPQYGTTEGVAILGLAKGDYMITLSPVRLGIQEGSPPFELLKKLANNAAQKL